MTSSLPDALKPYYGGFLNAAISPIALDFGYCGRCVYCFSDLAGQSRVNFNQAMSLISDFKNRDTLTASLLKQGYPIAISGTSDPFTPQYSKVSLPFLEVLCDLGIRFELITKGGEAAYTALEMLPWKIHWYISLAIFNEDLRERIEPLAPTIKERLDLIEAIASRGHVVSVGISPIMADWLPGNDAENLVAELKARGVNGIRAQKMHLSPKQLKNMPAAHRAKVTDIEIAKAKQGYRYPEQEEMYQRVRNAVLDAGIHFIDSQIKERSGFFEAIQALYPQHFPVMQDFVNWCYDTKEDENIFTWEEYRDFFVPKLPTGKHPVHDYIYARSLASTNKVIFARHKQTFEALLKTLWQNPQVTISPCNTECFAIAGEVHDEGYVQFVDDDNMPFLVFDRSGYPEAVTNCVKVA